MSKFSPILFGKRVAEEYNTVERREIWGIFSTRHSAHNRIGDGVGTLLSHRIREIILTILHTTT